MTMECVYIPVNVCTGDDFAVDIARLRNRTIYIVRGPEMFAIRLPDLPLPALTGSGAGKIEEMLGGE